MQVAENHHRGWMRPLAAALLPPLLLLAVSIGMWWKLVLTDQYTWLEGIDNSKHTLPSLQFQAGEWHRGRFPLWTPYEWFGQPLLGQAQAGAAYPPNWLLFSLPLNRGWLKMYYLNWYFVLARFLAALFCYWFCRDQGRSHAASLIAGCVFAFSGFMATNEWPQMFNGALWAPLVFLFVFRAWRGQQPLVSAWAAGLCLGMSWLSGHHQLPIFLTVTAGFLWLYITVENRRRIGAFALFLIAMSLMSGLQTLTAWEYGQHARRWAGAPEPLGWRDTVPYNVHAQFATPPASLVALVLPDKSVHTEPFMGATAVALAALGIWAGWKSRAVRALAAITVFGVLLAIGPATIVHGLLYSLVPLVEKARAPSTAVAIVNFSLAALTAWGIEYLREWKKTVVLAAALALFGASIIVLVRPTEDRTFTVALTSLLSAAGIAAFRNRFAGVPAAAAILIELSTVCGTYFPNRHDPNVTHYLNKMPQAGEIVSFLRQQPRPLRVAIRDEDVPYNMGDLYGVEQASAYLASLTDNLYGLELHTLRNQQLYAVDYYVAREPERPSQIPLFTGQSGLRVFANPGTLPRVRVVRKFERAADRNGIIRFIADESKDFSRTAVMLTEPPHVDDCDGPDYLRIFEHTPDRVRIRSRLACRGMVVLADTNFPGWYATVDGRSAQIHEVYGALRGVVVDRGQHTIEMTYRPWTARVGGVMTLAGLASALIVWLIARR